MRKDCCHVTGCKTKIKNTLESGKREWFRVPRGTLARIKWAQALQMTYEDLKDKYIVCRSHISVSEIVTKDDGSEVLSESAVPFPWTVTSPSPSSSKALICQYIQENCYPDTPLNKFAKEQMDYMAEVQPGLEYGETKTKIEEEWNKLSEDERYFYFDTALAQEEEWNKEHDNSHGESTCPIKPRARSSKSRKRKKSTSDFPKKIMKTTQVDLSLFTMVKTEVKTEDQNEKVLQSSKRRRNRRRERGRGRGGKGKEPMEQKEKPDRRLRKEQRMKRLKEMKQKRKGLKQDVKKEEGTEQESKPEGTKHEVKKEGTKQEVKKGESTVQEGKEKRKSDGPKNWQELKKEKSEAKTESITLKPELIENL